MPKYIEVEFTEPELYAMVNVDHIVYVSNIDHSNCKVKLCSESESFQAKKNDYLSQILSGKINLDA